MNFAIVNNNLVENKIVSSQEFANVLAQSNQFVILIDGMLNLVDIGYSYDSQSGTFTAPEPEGE